MLVQKYRIMFLVGNKLLKSIQDLVIDGKIVNSTCENDYYDNLTDAENTIKKMAQSNQETTIEYVIVPVYYWVK